MATTLSSFIPSTLHSNFEHSNFSYSYSDLPIFQSELNSRGIYEHNALRRTRPKSDYVGVYVSPEKTVNNVIYCANINNRTKECDRLPLKNLSNRIVDTNKKIVNDKYQCNINYRNINSDASIRQHIPLEPKAPPRTFVSRVSFDDRNAFKNDALNTETVLRPSKSFSRVEGLKKKFEFQSRLLNPLNKTKDEKYSFVNTLKIKINKCDIKSKEKNQNDKNAQRPNVIKKSYSAEDDRVINPYIKNCDNKNLFERKTQSNVKLSDDDKRFPPKPYKHSKEQIQLNHIVSNKVKKDNTTNKSCDVKISASRINSAHTVPAKLDAANVRQSPDKESERSSNLASSVLRLRNSIFSSLKLPRKVAASAKMNSQMSGRDTLPGRSYTMSGGIGSLSTSTMHSKRKSAVELLAESKAFYVKSETVLDRKQELPLRVNSTLSTVTNSGTHYATLSGRHRRNVGGEPLQIQLRRLLGSTSNQSPVTPIDTRCHTTSRYTERKSKENYEWDTNTHPAMTTRSHYNSATFSGNSSSGTSGSKGHVKSDPEHSRLSAPGCYSSKSLNRPSSSGDNRIFFPDSFIVPKPSKSDPANVFSNSFSIESPFSSPEKIDARQILSVVDAYDNYGRSDSKAEYYDDRDFMENYTTISPPAEYAVTERSNYRYVRSNSHSHTMKTNQENPYVINFNSHKSLPDLHKQGENFAENGRNMTNIGGSGHYLANTEIVHQKNRNVPTPVQVIHSNEALSCYSKTTSGRSYRSSALSSKGSEGYSRRSTSCHNSELSGHTGRGSADEVYYYNRSGSSYARDSGGSSGHCSGPLAPPSLRGLPPISTGSLQQRRDSGSSTQHSSTRSNRYSSYYTDRYQEPVPNESSHLEYHVSAPIQFQDGIKYNHGSSNSQLAVNATVSISTNFNTHDGFRTPGPQGCPTSDRPALVGIHFQASIPPVQFQDAQTPIYGYNGSYPSEGFYGRRESGTRESRHLLTRRPASSGCNQMSTCFDDENDGARSLPHEIESSPPGLGNFKRQRCLRYKHRTSPRRPILRSKSDISDRYWRGDDKGTLSLIEKTCDNTPPSSDNNSPNRSARIKLDKFFDQLGMDDDTYKEVILKDLKKPRRKKDKKKSKTSPLHGDSKSDIDDNSKCTDDEANDELSSSFASSDISFPDSNLIPNNADYTIQGGSPNDQKPYRSYEPLSIVERNARIIKWLCNCRKLQAV